MILLCSNFLDSTIPLHLSSLDSMAVRYLEARHPYPGLTAPHFLFPLVMRIPRYSDSPCSMIPLCLCFQHSKIPRYWSFLGSMILLHLNFLAALHCLAAPARVLAQVQAFPPHVLVLPVNPPRSAHSSPPETLSSLPHHTRSVVCFPPEGSCKAKLITSCKPYLSLPSRIFTFIRSFKNFCLFS